MVDVLDGPAGDGSGDDPFWEPPMFEVGPWLVRRRGLMETKECRWLEVLYDFDRDEAYTHDGHQTAASWLMWACGMARSTAYEKLRIAHQLARRPVVKEAFARAEISYSAARAICALDDPAPETDAALVNLARYGSVLDVEAAVRYYQCLAGQDIPPYEPDRRNVSSRKGDYGLGALRAVLSNDEVAFIEAVLKAFMAARADSEAVADGPFDDATAGGPLDDATPSSAATEESGESARADTDPSEPAGPAGSTETEPTGPAPTETDVTGPAAPTQTDATSPSAVAEESSESARADAGPPAAGGDGDPYEADEDYDLDAHVDDWKTIYGMSRADALMEVFSVALANLGNGHVAGADRYMIHLVADADGLRGNPGGTAELVDGSVLPGGVAAAMACDASFVAHLLADGSEPLALGRKVRDWTPAQRRAIKVRDRGRCRFPGCHRGITDIHHILPWEEGGATDLDNAALLCKRHHTLVHQGFRAEGNGNTEVVFHRPDGSVLGLSRPPRRPASLQRAA